MAYNENYDLVDRNGSIVLTAQQRFIWLLKNSEYADYPIDVIDMTIINFNPEYTAKDWQK